MSKLVQFPSTRRGKWIVFAIWLIALVAINGAQLPSKFTDAENNDSASFLPSSAESTQALNATKAIQGSESVAMIVVYRRAGGLTAGDRGRIAADRAELNALDLKSTTPFAEPTMSSDGTSALLVADVTTDGEPATITKPVDAVRSRVSDPGGGLAVKVTGGAGFSADAIKVFEGINGTLLLAAVSLVFVLLALIYRSPLFLWIPLLAVGSAEIASRALGYGVSQLGVTINGQSSSIMSVLVLGAGTDYALLLVSRYREELRHTQDKHDALGIALRQSAPAILASTGTVVLALLCLSFAEVNGTAGLGPLGALGVLTAMVSMLTFLPAMLAIFGRRAFWPLVPYGPRGANAADSSPPPGRLAAPIGLAIALLLDVAVVVGVSAALGAPAAIALGVVLAAIVAVRVAFGPLRRTFNRLEHRFSDVDEGAAADHGRWRRWGERIERRPRRVWVLTTIALAAMAAGVLNFDTGLTQSNAFRDRVESIEGQDLLAKAFPSGGGAPTDLVVTDPAKATDVARAVRDLPGVAAVDEVARGKPGVQFAVTLREDPYSTKAYDEIDVVRTRARSVGGDAALVGGPTAIERDLRAANTRDTKLIIPLVLIVVFAVLVALLRSLAAPLMLIGTVVLSFAAAIGVSAVVYDIGFGFPGSDPSLPLFAFVFLVALGIDYNIFLMARVREEAQRFGTRTGMLRGLAVTGGVITSAGIVLAGTFAVLAALPLAFLTQVGFAIAFGVLLDTFVVRSTLVPALVLDIGRHVWWPSRLAGEDEPAGPEPELESPAPDEAVAALSPTGSRD